MAEIHVADVGTAFVCTIVDEDGAVVDVSSATVKQLWFQKPDQSTVAFDAAFVTDGTDGKIRYVTSAASDLDQSGGWKLQGHVAFGGYVLHSDVHKFKVFANLM